MAFYVMHDTFITQQRTNYFPKKLNSDREKERSDTKVHFRNNHANISVNISKKLNNNNKKIKEGIAELTQSRVMNDKTTTVKENQLDVKGIDKVPEATDIYQEYEDKHLKQELSSSLIKENFGNEDMQETYNDSGEKQHETHHIALTCTNFNFDEESFLADKNKNIKINQLNEDNNSNINKIEHLNKNTLQTNFVWKQMDKSVIKEEKKAHVRIMKEKEHIKIVNQVKEIQNRVDEINPHQLPNKHVMDYIKKSDNCISNTGENLTNQTGLTSRSSDIDKTEVYNVGTNNKIIQEGKEKRNLNMTKKDKENFTGSDQHAITKVTNNLNDRRIRKEYDKYRIFIVEKKTPFIEFEEVAAKLQNIETCEIRRDSEILTDEIDLIRKNGRNEINSPNMPGEDCEDSQLYWIFLVVSWLPLLCLISWVF